VLQEKIASEHLLLSHVPFFKYFRQDYQKNRLFFPERNRIMAALSDATIIAEASNQSGSLIQARECLRLNKKLIILKPMLDDKTLTWPKAYRARGALVVETMGDIKAILGPNS
ncbi:MAG: DNA-processing protein DprA, partial [Planctomycetota bacterium]|nr:DNA-processing protein DprA [Planctomycetota bacterium]